MQTWQSLLRQKLQNLWFNRDHQMDLLCLCSSTEVIFVTTTCFEVFL